MDTVNEDIIYDAMVALQENSKILKDFVNKNGDKKLKQAYQDGIYSPVVALSVALTREIKNRGALRHKKIIEELKLFENKK